ncbi:hypothetical protein LINGRAHAP2_LOCUS31882 [Linum grandiflorum]
MFKEKQISFDPVSQNLPPIIVAPKIQPPSPPQAKPPLISFTLHNSPRFGFWLTKKFQSEASPSSPSQLDGISHRKSSTVHPNQYHRSLVPDQETRLQRSKSCAEGRSSGADELDIWFKNREDEVVQSSTIDSPTVQQTNEDRKEDEFKCGTLCLCIGRFGSGKGKLARERKLVETESEGMMETSISRTVSMEKFECGSWASLDSTRFYYDLPLELVKANVNEVNSPVTAAFVFDKDWKKGSTARAAVHRNSQESSARNELFSSSSASSPSSPAPCITPQLQKAREEFNAFLKAEADA